MPYNFEEDEEEENDFLGVYDLDKGYGGQSPTSDTRFTPMFSYTHIDIGITDYHFHRAEFDGRDRMVYFEKLKNYSKYSLEELMNSRHTEHFRINTSFKGREIELVSKLFNKEIKPENCPVIGHFALYTTDAPVADIEAGIVQSPRIYFLLDKQSTFHILFYDPFHQINPMGKETIASLKKQEGY